MTLPSLATIINFCSNDYPFLRACIDSIKPVSSQLLVPVCDHFFDGHPEDRDKLERIYAETPDVEFYEFPYDDKQSFYGAHSSVHWHNLARMIGTFFLKESIDYVLFLDCDEIADTARFAEWLQSAPLKEYSALQLLNYWYFRESDLQAKTWEHTPLLIRKEALEGAVLMNEHERAGMFDLSPENKRSDVAGEDQLPMFHHYSWVRTESQLLRKVKSWSHNWQRDWTRLVEEEFSREFNGTDFVHGYEFSRVSPFVDIDLQKQPSFSAPMDLSHVRRLSHEDVLKIDISLTYRVPLCLSC